jgi:hypothetical protein
VLQVRATVANIRSQREIGAGKHFMESVSHGTQASFGSNGQ